MKTLRWALWWAGMAWVLATILMLGKIFLAPELGISTPLADPTVSNVSLAMLFGSLVVLFFTLPPIEPVALLAIGLFAAMRTAWRRPWGR